MASRRKSERADGEREPLLTLVLAENLEWLCGAAAESFELIYVDPPFNTGKPRRERRLRAVRDPASERVGFGGVRYRMEPRGEMEWDDRFDDYLAFLRPRLAQARRVLTAHGSLFVHVDPRESHYVKIALDELFGRASFVNEIVWAYDYGARSRTRWSAKHDVIFWYAKDPERYTFELDAIDRIPYLAPKLVGAEKAARGKTPTDVWWNTIVSPTGKERTGYPTQKPLAIAKRIVATHSRPGERVLDFFAGSGTIGAACAELGRSCVLVDRNPDALRVMKRRFAALEPRVIELKKRRARGA
jgi:site-specific DNA-methyltransferase (adenine-specific)